MEMILSIGIVAYNEERFLPSLLHDLEKQSYSHKLIEILLIDSCSSDRTRLIMEEFKDKNKDFYSIQVLENTKGIQASGWNIAINNFTGDVLARIDAHAKLDSEYSKKIIEGIQSGESVMGGIRQSIAEKNTRWSAVLLQVENSLFGSSINTSRHSEVKKYVKTMFHAAYKRNVLDEVGLFNEDLLRTEDNEYHYRIRKAGYRLCYDPQIISFQYMRSSFGDMLKQKFGNGLWIGKTLKVCPECISLYHLVPGLFVVAIIVTSIMCCFGIWYLSALMWIMYGFFALGNTIFSVVSNRVFPEAMIMPFLFLLLHISYGVGTLWGLVGLK